MPKHGETFNVGDNIKVTAVHTPCHTQDSICYLFEDGNDRAVFTGDTLFIGGKQGLLINSNARADIILGCGRFFEGTPEEMDTALNKTLGGLPDDAKVYVSFQTLPEWTELILQSLATSIQEAT